MFELPAGARLTHEALRQSGRRGQTQVEHLHRDVAVLRMVTHAEHGGEAAFAQQIPDGILLAESFLEAATQRAEIERHGGRETSERTSLAARDRRPRRREAALRVART